MRSSKKQLDLSRDFLLYGLSFLLLMEWLIPLPYVTDTGYIHVFVLCTAVFFFITLLQLPVIVSVGLKSLVVLYGLYLVFFQVEFLSLEWVSLILEEVVLNVGYMLSGSWHALTDLFRSLLFFVLLAIMSYLLFYWIIYARRVLFFLIFTVTYIAVIDTFTLYDATFAIVRTFFVGFLLLGLVTMYRFIEQERLHSASKLLPARLGVVLLFILVVGGFLGMLFPKPEPQWADPVPFVRAAIGLEANDPVRRIGYGDYDEQLGGGFVDDNSTIFYAATSQEHYWRGETKDYYTGRGWETTTPAEMKHPLYRTDREGFLTVELQESEIVFEDESDFDHLFYPGEFAHLLNHDTINVTVDGYTERANTFHGDDPIALSRYRFEYVYPSFHIDGLRSSNEADPDFIVDYYTQIPDTLPDRIKELAEEIVAEEDSRYDKAKAIEQYFRLSDFTYETEDVPIPSNGQDYVDQFLFETRRGYCDNFSTSMIVMLRTLDIPARWVKGFTQGAEVEQLSHDRSVYEVTNSNAHSWVEVYFPEVGWVPFEPTQGFSNMYDFLETYEEEAPVEEEEVTDATNEEEEIDEQENEEAEMEEEEQQSEESVASVQNWTIPGGKWILLGMLLIGTIILIMKMKKIVLYINIKWYEKSTRLDFVSAFERLLRLLAVVGYKRQSGETLRVYAKRIDKQFDTDEMGEMTREYERILYGGKSEHSSWKQQKGHWVSFVKKMNS
ncbi:transglutaminaseTgpA domain-containing protein [Bacillus sp. JCM 19034]|uniref:transglutaminase TgpA family protein n=1 Tax=Bacillus sp. JCM 19034 TaxID=1481928 RepID=UPI000781EFAE|nr:transglutaminaseTgpA domain-containing protein [Bacillus sp. JCM 19034]